METAPLPTHRVIAIVGAGAMGSGIAQVAAAAGHPVKLLDARDGAAAKAIEGIRAQFARLAEKGRITTEAARAASDRLSVVSQLSELTDAALVIEAIVENLEAKQKLFTDLETWVAEDCILATNTSSISITAIGAALRSPGRLAGLHFFNPAPLMALVEIVSGLATDKDVAETLHNTAKSWGKAPVYARSTPGFIVNRVARPFYAEALRLLQEGATDYATVDAVMRDAGGFRMGPFELMDLIGHDVNFAVTKSVWSAFYHDQRFLPSLIQQELVEAGFLGRKSGRGFYDYRDGAQRPPPQTESPRPLADVITLCGNSVATVALASRLTQAGVTFERHQDSKEECIARTGSAALFVTDGRSATQRAALSGTADTVVIDLALDYTTTPRIAIASAAQCAANAADAAIALLQAAGLQVSRFADVPGLAVMRTVAMLANEAADTVNQGVCTAEGADAAMRLGVNYPRGPLAWADDIGVAVIRDTLLNLGNFYGEERYRVSPLIHQAFHAQRKLHDGY